MNYKKIDKIKVILERIFPTLVPLQFMLFHTFVHAHLDVYPANLSDTSIKFVLSNLDLNWVRDCKYLSGSHGTSINCSIFLVINPKTRPQLWAESKRNQF